MRGRESWAYAPEGTWRMKPPGARDDRGLRRDSVLPETEYVQLRKGMSELDWEDWDRQIGADSEAGRLELPVGEGREAREHGVLNEL